MPDGSPAPSPAEPAGQQFLFAGTALSRKPIPTGNPEAESLFLGGSATVFRLEHVWKPADLLVETITVYTAFTGGVCGFRFHPGRCYLVFGAVGEDGMLRTSICTRTSEWPAAQELLRWGNVFLGPPQPSYEVEKAEMEALAALED